MDCGSYQRLFKQAVVGGHPDVLCRINHPHVNLVVWKDAVQAPSTANYLNQLDLGAMCPDRGWRDGYFKPVANMAYLRSWNREAHKAAQEKIDDELEKAGFPAQGAGKDETRRNLVAQICRLTDYFARAMGEDQTYATLLIFKSYDDDDFFWHTDEGPVRGVATLSGDNGTVWLPEYTLPKNHDRRATYWDEALGRAYDSPLPVQTINPGDMAIFKCAAQEKPLVHASPHTAKPRLVLLM